MILKEIDKYLKCDFHMHSGSCYSRKYTNEEFMQKLRDIDLDCLAITDHNIIDIELYKKIYEDKKINKKIIGGIELNVKLDDAEIKRYELVIKENVEYFHGILLFDYSDIENVWNKLLNNVIISKYKFIQNEKNIKDISKKLEGKCFDLIDIQKALKDCDYYFIFHENKGDRNLSDYLPNHKGKELYENNINYKDKLFYYNNKYAIEGNQKNKKICSSLEKELSIIVSRFFFSDAVDINDIGRKFTWINFDGSFGDLILPFSDPETRIFTSDEYSECPQKNKRYLSSIKIKLLDENTKIEKEKEIFFSPGLNGIIGSRGSGKSMLGSILSGNGIGKYFRYINIDEIKYKINGSNYSRNVPKCKYLKQNSLLKIYEEKNFKELDFVKETYEKIIEEKKSSIKNLIENIVDEIEKEKEYIEKFYFKYKDNVIYFWDFLKNTNCENKLIKEIDKRNFKNNYKESNDIKNSIELLKQNLEVNQQTINGLEFSDVYNESRETFEYIQIFKTKNVEMLKNVIKNIEDLTEMLNSKEIIFKKREKLIGDIEALINQNNVNINNGASIQKEQEKTLKQYFDDLYRLRCFLVKSYNRINQNYNKIYVNQLEKTLSIEKNSKITLKTKISDEQSYLNIINEQLKIQVQEYSEFWVNLIFKSKDNEQLKKFFSGQKYKGIEGFEKYIERFYNNIMKKIKESQEVDLEIIYNELPLEEYSPGKQSEILLDIFLHYDVFDNKDYDYIVLDQPEDNLDTNTIIEVLVNKIRKMKQNIQIFVISHSAPVIINSDSNIIICANNDDKKIDYNSGKINDETLKKVIVKILDGGEKNLKMRLNKYDFKIKGE